MSRQRRQREEEAMPASTFAFWTIVVNGLFLLLFGGAFAGFVYLIAIGWWNSPLELLAAAVLIVVAVLGVAFFADGIRRDLRGAGWSARGEGRQLLRRFRRRPGGPETFASQRFTGRTRRRW